MSETKMERETRVAIQKLHDAITFVNRFHPLPRCIHGHALKDGGGEILEPPCGCRTEAKR